MRNVPLIMIGVVRSFSYEIHFRSKFQNNDGKILRNMYDESKGDLATMKAYSKEISILGRMLFHDLQYSLYHFSRYKSCKAV